MSSTDTNPSQEIRKRRVFYIPGYDPIHPRRYRELYRKEGTDQAAISGYDLALKPKQTKGPYGWHVTAQIDGADVQTDVQVLVWSDIVRDSMERGIFGTYMQMIRTAWTYIASGVLWRLMRLRKGPVIAALYPVGMLILQLILAVLLGWLVFAGIRRLLEILPQLIFGEGVKGGHAALHVLVALGVSAGAAVWLLRWFKKKDGKFFAYYLMHDYAYSAASKGANPPELEARMAEFGDHIAEALATDVDEVLIVGHSSGAHLGVSVLADLLRAQRLPTNGPRLNFLSLGQVVPMVSFLPKATRLRADLQFLSEQDQVAWVDVTAPGDGCAFALCDPVAVSGVSRDGKRWPLVFSAAFTQTLKPETWKALRWKFFRLHFQYLCAFDNPGDYDYFQITAGPLSLRSRYKDRAASKSLIDAAVSKYVSTSP